MKRFFGAVVVCTLVAAGAGNVQAAYVSVEGEGGDRTGVVRTEASSDASSSAESAFRAEVMTLEGSVVAETPDGKRSKLSEGDLLGAGDRVEVASGARVDVAFDKDWQNVARFDGPTRFAVRGVEPARVYLPKGSVYARLKNLPKESSFEVETPTAVAAVRGSEYQVDVDDAGKTDVSNLSESPVFVNSVGASSEAERVVLSNSQVTRVATPGGRPEAPRAMPAEARKRAEARRDGVVERIGRLKQEGRQGRIQDVGAIDRVREARGGEGRGPKREGVPGQENARRGDEIRRVPGDAENARPESGRAPEGPRERAPQAQPQASGEPGPRREGKSESKKPAREERAPRKLPPQK